MKRLVLAILLIATAAAAEWKFNPHTGKLDYYESGASGAAKLDKSTFNAYTSAGGGRLTVTGSGAGLSGVVKTADTSIKNVRTLGLVGDASDEGAEIQALLNAAVDGNVFYFPTGTYGSSVQITLPQETSIQIIGDGPQQTWFKALSSMTSFFYKAGGSTVVQRPGFENFGIQCNMLAGIGMELQTYKNARLERLYIDDYTGDSAILLGKTSGSGGVHMFYEGKINDVTTYLNTGNWPDQSTRPAYGIHFQATASDNFVSKVVTSYAKTSGIFDAAYGNNKFTQLHPWGTASYPTQYGVTTNGNATISASEFDTCATAGVKIGSYGQVTVTGNLFVNNIPTGVEIASGTPNVAIAGNVYSAEVTNKYIITGAGVKGTNFTFVEGLDSALLAPTDATYIVQTASSGLSAEQALSSLSTGFMRVANGTGVITSDTSTYYKSGDQATLGRVVVSGSSLGSGTSPIAIFPTVTNADVLNFGGTTQNLDASATYKSGLHVNPNVVPTATKTDDYYGVLTSPTIKASGGTSYNLTTAKGGSFQIQADSAYTGTIANVYGLEIADATKNGGSAVFGTQYGLRVQNMTTAGTNYSLYTGTGLVRFGDNVSTTGTMSAKAYRGDTLVDGGTCGASATVTITPANGGLSAITATNTTCTVTTATPVVGDSFLLKLVATAVPSTFTNFTFPTAGHGMTAGNTYLIACAAFDTSTFQCSASLR